MSEGMRLDKWLWAARFFKTRSLAAEAIDKGRVTVNELPAKRGRELRVGDRVGCTQPGDWHRTVVVQALSVQRGPASVAQTLYEETAQSLQKRQEQALQRRLAPEPAATLAQGRPTKRDRRQLAQWNRWSVSVDDAPAPAATSGRRQPTDT